MIQGYFIETDRKGMDKDMYLKHIPLDGPKNFRDLGGFLAKDGRAVRWNRLYRSDRLDALSEKDLSAIQARNIRAVIDLRSPAEQEESPDVAVPGAAHFSCPLTRAVTKTAERFSGADKAAEEAFLKSMEMDYVTILEEGADLVRTAVQTVMEQSGQGAVVFHCTAGKDRTGILAALLLLVLGVSEEDIIADYQVSHTYNEKGVNRVMDRLPFLKDYAERTGEKSMFHSPPGNIRRVLQALPGDRAGAWLEALGVSGTLQRQFRERMLAADKP